MSTTHDSMVVVTRGSSYSEEFAKHAIHMAHEYHWDLIALHVGSPLSNLVQPHRARYCSEFLSNCEKGIDPIAKAAQGEGVSFSQVVRFGGTEVAVRSVCTENGHVKCVLVDQDA